MSLFLNRLLPIIIVLGILALLEWAFGLGKYLSFFLLTLLIGFIPLWFIRKIYVGRQEPSWFNLVAIVLTIVWMGAQLWYIGNLPGNPTPQQLHRIEFLGTLLFTIPSTIFRLFFIGFLLFIGLAGCVLIVLGGLKVLLKLFRKSPS